MNNHRANVVGPAMPKNGGGKDRDEVTTSTNSETLGSHNEKRRDECDDHRDFRDRASTNDRKRCRSSDDLIDNMNPKVDLDVLGQQFKLEKESESDVNVDGCKAGNETCKANYLSESLKLEAEVDRVLEALRKSQKNEYNLAEEKLNALKKHLQSLHLQFEREKFEFAHAPNASRLVVFFETVISRNDQLEREVLKFEDMKKIANGFGSTSKDILEKHFGL